MSYNYGPDQRRDTISSDTPEISNSMTSPSATTTATIAATAADLHIPTADGKRQRVSRACDRCRRKKVKCDGKQPICTHCSAIGIKCTYLDATKKRGPPKGYIEVIENRLHKVEELLCGLIMTDSNAARHVLDDLKSSDGSEAAVVSDASGKLFGMLSMSELESRANNTEQHLDKAPAPTLSLSISTKPAPAPAPAPGTISNTSNISAAIDTYRQHYEIEPSVAAAAKAAEARKKHRLRNADNGDSESDSYGNGGGDDADNNDSQAEAHRHQQQQMTMTDRASDDSSGNGNGSGEEDDCTENLTRLEKRVGHLTLDQSGSLRYLGNSSGWYIINRSLMSSEASPRLTKGLDGVIRWPPISTMPTRGNENEIENEASSDTGPNAEGIEAET
ncbi:hypothetical protein FB639_003437, partial [Coemansia asiatica]